MSEQETKVAVVEESFAVIVAPAKATMSEIAVRNTDLAAQVRALGKIDSDDKYVQGAALMKAGMAILSQADSITDETVKAAFAAHKAAKNLQNTLKAPTQAVVDSIREDMNRYNREKAERQRKEQEEAKRLVREAAERRAREEAEARQKEEAARKQQEAEEAQRRAEQARQEAEAWGTDEDLANAAQAECAAKALQEEAKAVAEAETVIPEIPVPDVTVGAPAPKVEGVSTRKVWRWRLVDFAQVPDQYKALDETKVNGVVKALKDGAAIPGIEVYAEEVIAVRK